MASTNKTTNYELSQFVGSDKPAWLSDYNGDMSKIDTGIHTAQTTATGADGKADANATNIGNLGYLSTANKTDLVSAINEVDGNTDTAQNTANSANTKANNCRTDLNKFNLTERSTLTPSTTRGTINSSVTNVQFATDTTSSIFKIYGRVYIDNLNGATGNITVTLGQTTLRPANAYTINTGAIVNRLFPNNTIKSDTVPRNITVGTDGVITLTDTISISGLTEYSIMIPPCLYFNTDFGDA